MLEFPFDTTRTIASLVFEGVVTRFPSIRWIFSHAGGALPYLAGRIEVLAKNNPKLAECIPQGFASMLRTMYFDCALSANHVHFKTLRELLPDTQLLLGTDYPYGPENQMLGTVKALQVLGLPVSTLDALYRGNALDLFPRLRAKS
ncbi:Amidohydrolase [compost metagenome]